MRSERNEKEYSKEMQKKHDKMKALIVSCVCVLVLAAGVGFRIYTADKFPAKAKVNGISVGGMTLTEASKKITKEANQIRLKEDNNKAVSVTTKFTFGIADALKYRLALSSIDPRNYVGSGGDYTVSLKVSGGIKKSAKVIRKKIPDRKGSVKTQNAHINYEKMKIVKEVYSNTLDENALAKTVAKSREEEPRTTTISFKSKDYVLKPTIKSADLKDELAFAKKYLSKTMTLTESSGSTVTVTSTQLAKVILYSKDGPKYSEDGAKTVAKQIASNYHQYTYTVSTQEGKKTLTNYVINHKVNQKKTANAIYEAAKAGEHSATLYLQSVNRDLSTRVEVSLSNQTVYYVQNGKVKMKTSVVTGGGVNATPRGIFQLSYKEKNVTLKGSNDDGSQYASKVQYWMPFNGGIGLHDASWRSTFGGTIYKTNGSHGCVNMPPAKAKQLYGYVQAGTLVYVY
jgi:lipoprotein-anchoring transpeptidase ErfK/SrfK